MLQYLTQTDEKYSLAEQMQMVIEGGCGWIVISERHDGDWLRTHADEFLPLCRETGIIVTVENRPELAKELGVHGVWLTDTEVSPMKVREELGPEAIIGVRAESPATVSALKGMDADYASVDMALGLERIAELVEQCRQGGIQTPIVGVGDVSLETLPDLLATGISGVCTGASIMDAVNPPEYTDRMISALYANS